MANVDDGWYIQHKGTSEQHGPYSLKQVLDASRTGRIVSETLLFHTKLTGGQWISASSISQIADVIRGEPSREPPRLAVDARVKLPDAPPVEIRVRQREPKVPSTLGSAVLAVFDFKFRYYVTPWIIKITWAICVMTASMFLALLVFSNVISPIIESLTSDNQSASRPTSIFSFPGFSIFQGVIGKITGWLMLLNILACMLLWVRVVLESSYVFFQIGEDLRALRANSDHAK